MLQEEALQKKIGAALLLFPDYHIKVKLTRTVASLHMRCDVTSLGLNLIIYVYFTLMKFIHVYLNFIKIINYNA